MAGITDLPFRALCRQFGAGLTVSEMVSAKALWYGDKKTQALLPKEGERPVAVQIFGHEPEIMAHGARLVAPFCDIIDINMGCPAPKIASNGDGAALMQSPGLAGDIVAAVTAAVRVPVTVKIRKGWTSETSNAVEIAQIAEKNGAAAISVHGRTRAQFYSGAADWETIRDVVRAVNLPVVGNGDVKSGPDAAKMLSQTGCAGVMVGRAAQGNPWIFREISCFLETGEILPPPSDEEKVEIALSHLQHLIAEKGEYIGVREGRKHAAWYMKGMRGAARAKEEINRAKTFCEAAQILKNLLT